MLFVYRTRSGMLKKKDESTRNASMSNDKLHVKTPMKYLSGCWSSLKQSFNNNFERLFNFKASNVLSFEKFTKFLYRPTDPASLGVARALFGKSIHEKL